MKNLFVLFALTLFAFSCEQEDVQTTETTLRFYAIHACGQETDLRDETPAAWADRVTDLVEESGVEVITYELDFEKQGDQGWCGNCQRSGDLIRVSVALDDEEALRDLGFVD